MANTKKKNSTITVVLAKNEVDKVIKNYAEAAEDIQHYLDKEFSNLTKNEYDILWLKQQILRLYALSVIIQSVGMELVAAFDAQVELVKSTADARAALASLKDAKVAIQIVTAMIDIGAGIAAKDPQAVVKGIVSLVDSIGKIDA